MSTTIQTHMGTARDALERIGTVEPAEFLPLFAAGSDACEALRDFETLRVLQDRAVVRAGEIGGQTPANPLWAVVRVRRQVLGERVLAHEVALRSASERLGEHRDAGVTDPATIGPLQEEVARCHSEGGNHAEAARWYAKTADLVFPYDRARAVSLRARSVDAVATGEGVAMLRSERARHAVRVGPAESRISPDLGR